MYDFTHCLSDSIEGITHSLCTLEFEDRRPLYDWYIDQLGLECHPQQIEFARLNLNYTILSKRKLLHLVKNKLVNGWDDPRMPTVAGIRRRGYTPAAIRNFCERIGVSKASNSVVDIALLEYCVREELNRTALRTMAVLNPLKVVIENYPDDQTEELDYQNHPEYPELGSRKVNFSKTIYIEKEDFMEEPQPKFYRLSPGCEVRLRYAYFVRCEKVIKDENGEIVELRCSYDPASKGGNSPDGRKVKATLHWLSAEHSQTAEIRLYDRLFTKANPDEEEDFCTCLNPDSLQTLTDSRIEPFLCREKIGGSFQFERQGYFCIDSDSTPEKPVLNRIVSLKDSWAKQAQK
jgi:glutaminyl-tRNA synthetase